MFGSYTIQIRVVVIGKLMDGSVVKFAKPYVGVKANRQVWHNIICNTSVQVGNISTSLHVHY